MRTADEILARIQADTSFFGFGKDVLVSYLPADKLEAAGYALKDGVEWAPRPATRESVIEEMRDYMDFAWEKAIDERGLSANRSVEKLHAWLWLLGDDEALAFALDTDRHYAPYGKPILRFVSERFGFPIPVGA